MTRSRHLAPLPRGGLSATGGVQGPSRASRATGRAQVRYGVAAAAGLLADRMLGEPPAPIHPVAAFGRAMSDLERRVWRDSRPAGAGYAATGIGLGWAAGLARGPSLLGGRNRHLARRRRTGPRATRPGRSASGWPTTISTGPGGGCRRSVGRDPESLDAKEVARAVVESVAENTVDAVVAPACWAAVGGAPGAAVYRAVNTLDAMVGHRNERYRPVRLGRRPPRRRRQLDPGPPDRRSGRRRPPGAGPRGARRRRAAAGPPVAPTPAWPRRRSPPPSASASAATPLRRPGRPAARLRHRPPARGRRHRRRRRLSRDVTLALAALLATPAVLRVRAHHRPAA